MKHCGGWLIILLIFAVSCAAQNRRLNDGPKGPMEDRINDYFKAFNSGDEKAMADFLNNNLTAEALQRRPLTDQIEFYKQVRAEMQKIGGLRFRRTGDQEISVLAESENGAQANFNFRFEAAPPHKINGLRIEKTPGPQDSVNAPQNKLETSSLTETELIAATGKLLEDSAKADVFSGAVLIAKKETPIFLKAFGAGNKEKNIPNKTDTKFNLGSLNKTFTQVAFEQLAAKGKISYDDKLGKYLPDYPNKDAREKVTVRHLLEMTSGIGDIFGNKFRAMPKDKLRSIKDFIPLFADQPLAFEPGTQNQYSNGGYILLGAIIEKASGQSYYDYVRENIFAPLGMKNTEFYEADQTIPNLAEGYTEMGSSPEEKGPRRNNLETRPAKGSSAGGGYSTAEDLLKFSLALQSGKIRLPDGTPARKDAAGKFLGMRVGGGAPGINTAFEISDGYTLIVLSNYDPPSAEKMSRQISEYLSRLKK